MAAFSPYIVRCAYSKGTTLIHDVYALPIFAMVSVSIETVISLVEHTHCQLVAKADEQKQSRDSNNTVSFFMIQAHSFAKFLSSVFTPTFGLIDNAVL